MWQDDDALFDVVVNDEEQYSIWPQGRDLPDGWFRAGKGGPKAQCLSFIEGIWTDMRPRALRLAMTAAGR